MKTKSQNTTKNSKICKSCNKRKSVKEFRIVLKIYYTSYCKKCLNAKNAVWAKKNVEANRKKAREHYRRKNGVKPEEFIIK